MFDDYMWKSYVYRTTFYNVKYQDVQGTMGSFLIPQGHDCLNVYKLEVAVVK